MKTCQRARFNSSEGQIEILFGESVHAKAKQFIQVLIIGDDIAITQLPGNVAAAHCTSISHEACQTLHQSIHSPSLAQGQTQLDQTMVKKKRIESPR